MTRTNDNLSDLTLSDLTIEAKHLERCLGGLWNTLDRKPFADRLEAVRGEISARRRARRAKRAES